MLFVRLELKILWAKNFLGLAIDQVGTRHNLPITSYYFWPKTEAWEQLKLELGLKPWVEEKEKVMILNLAAEVMNFWRANRNTEMVETVMTRFSDANFVKINI
jgi:30S ribosomal protein 3